MTETSQKNDKGASGDTYSEVKNSKIGLPLLIVNATLVCLVLSFSFMIYRTKEPVSPTVVAQKKVDMSAFTNLALDAQSVYIWDISKQQVIYAKDENTVRPLASLTKVMTAVTALSILPLNTTVTINKEFLSEEGDSGLYVNEKWSLKNLLDFSLTVSSNDGAHSIAAVAGAFASSTDNYDIGLTTFINLMNDKAKSLGYKSMYFTNVTGLDTSTTASGGMGSAEDMSKLMEFAMKKYPDLFEATKDSSEIISSYDKTHVAINTDEAVTKVPNLIASKTGYTSLAGGNLSVVFDAGVGRPIVITVLGSSYDGRFSDVEKLASSTLAYLRDNQ
jgi:D-alanyl-D-alanine carboxypeptidase